MTILMIWVIGTGILDGIWTHLTKRFWPYLHQNEQDKPLPWREFLKPTAFLGEMFKFAFRAIIVMASITLYLYLLNPNMTFTMVILFIIPSAIASIIIEELLQKTFPLPH